MDGAAGNGSADLSWRIIFAAGLNGGKPTASETGLRRNSHSKIFRPLAHEDQQQSVWPLDTKNQKTESLMAESCEPNHSVCHYSVSLCRLNDSAQLCDRRMPPNDQKFSDSGPAAGAVSAAAKVKWARILALLDWQPPAAQLSTLNSQLPKCPGCGKPMFLLGTLPRAPTAGRGRVERMRVES